MGATITTPTIPPTAEWPNLPAKLTIEASIKGVTGEFQLPLIRRSSTGNFGWTLKVKGLTVPGVEDIDTALAGLRTLTHSFEGDLVASGDVYLSKPYVKDGQVRSKGGNPTTAQSMAVEVRDTDGEVHHMHLFCRWTWTKKNNFVVNIDVRNTGGGSSFEQVGEFSGFGTES